MNLDLTAVSAANPLPRHAVLRGRGRCRVLSYEGDGYFRVLTNRDETVRTHRDRLVFTG